MKTFNELWQYVTEQRPGVITVQERSELEHVFNLMRGCDCRSYLEVGTAEGNSLYVLGHAVEDGAGEIHFIDLFEPHTQMPRKEIVGKLMFGKDSSRNVFGIKGDSTYASTYFRDPDCLKYPVKYDCVLIDGGHDFATVLSDAILYAPLATKYIFFHDIQLPDVRAAVEWWHKRWQLGKYTEFINSPNFGYAIIEVKK